LITKIPSEVRKAFDTYQDFFLNSTVKLVSKVERLKSTFPQENKSFTCWKNYIYLYNSEHAAEEPNKETFVFSDDDNLEFKFTFPASQYKEPQRYDILGVQKVLILSDIHFPYQDNLAIKTALQYGAKQGMEAIYLNGDIMDFYQASRFRKNPLEFRIFEEIEVTKRFLNELRSRFPSLKIYYKMGNHEDRLNRLLEEKAPELIGVEAFKFENFMEFRKLNIEFVDNYAYAKLGKLTIIHGHEFRIGGGQDKNAINLNSKARVNCIMGHFHAPQTYFYKNLNGETIGTWVTGALCGLSPKYHQFNNWKHGFAFVELEKNGNFKLQNKIILNGVVF